MDKHSYNENDMRNELLSAMELPADGGDIELDDETIAMVAEGGLSQLPADAQQKILRAIAKDPIAGEMLAELSQLDIAAEQESASTGENADNASRNRTLKFSTITRTLMGSWAIAAAFLMAVTLWPQAEISQITGQPAGNGGTNATGTNNQVQVYSNNPSSESYWDQLNKKRIAENNTPAAAQPVAEPPAAQLRDYALAGSIALCILLSAALIVSLLNDNSKSKQQKC